MSTRLQRVEELLRREIADVLLRGEVRDPRVRETVVAISITGVRCAADLGSARVFVDVLSAEVDRSRVIVGLNAAAGVIRGRIGDRVRLKRTPMLRFEEDESLERAQAIEQTLAEIRAEEPAATVSPAEEDG